MVNLAYIDPKKAKEELEFTTEYFILNSREMLYQESLLAEEGSMTDLGWFAANHETRKPSSDISAPFEATIN